MITKIKKKMETNAAMGAAVVSDINAPDPLDAAMGVSGVVSVAARLYATGFAVAVKRAMTAVPGEVTMYYI